MACPLGSWGSLLLRLLDLWSSLGASVSTSCPWRRCCPPRRSLLPPARVVLASQSAGSAIPGSRSVAAPAGGDSCAAWILPWDSSSSLMLYLWIKYGFLFYLTFYILYIFYSLHSGWSLSLTHTHVYTPVSVLCRPWIMPCSTWALTAVWVHCWRRELRTWLCSSDSLIQFRPSKSHSYNTSG